MTLFYKFFKTSSTSQPNKPLNLYIPEAATGGVLQKKMFLKISQNPHQNTCARVSIFCNFIKKETLAQVLSCEFCESFKNTFFTEHLRTTASSILKVAETVLWLMFQILRYWSTSWRHYIKTWQKGSILEEYVSQVIRRSLSNYWKFEALETTFLKFWNFCLLQWRHYVKIWS